jgi:hypothetical protein
MTESNVFKLAATGDSDTHRLVPRFRRAIQDIEKIVDPS